MFPFMAKSTFAPLFSFATKVNELGLGEGDGCFSSGGARVMGGVEL